MSIKGALRDVWVGFRSLITGMRITFGQAMQKPVTVQYPHETLKMPPRFRGHIELLLDPETNRSLCTACGLCVRACPSSCLEVEGAKREGEKKKSVTKYELDFSTCSLCGSCVEACPSDAIGFSKDYNVVSFTRDDFSRMDLVKRLDAVAAARGGPIAPPATPAVPAPAPATPALTPATPAPASASAAPAPVPAAATPTPAALAPALAPSAASTPVIPAAAPVAPVASAASAAPTVPLPPPSST